MNNHSRLAGDVAGVMKNAKDVNKDSDSKTLPNQPNRLCLSSSFGPHLGPSRLSGLPLGNFGIPPNLHPQLQLPGFPPPTPGGIVYPNQFQNNLNSAVLMASLTNRHDHMRIDGCPPLQSLLSSTGGSPSLANYHATMAAADISRQQDLLSFLKDSNDRQKAEIFSYISKLAAANSISSTSSSLSSSSLSSSSSPSSSSSFHFHHQDSPAKSDVSPPDKRSPRPSSISPSSYMTPRSLNGSPSIGTPNLGTHLSILSPSHINNRTFVNGAISPPPLVGSSSSPLGISNNRIDSTSLTPTRKSSTPKPDKVFPCNVCGRTFGYKHVLQNHERTHTGEKPFECKECRKKFTRDHHLKTHMRLHTGEKPYHCDQCDRQFVQVANLRRHLRVHTGERPYSCESCPSKFSDSNQLKAHLLIHKNEKPFSCTKCTRIFRRRHHLIHHKCSNDSDDERPLDHIGHGKDLFYSESETTPYREFLSDREGNMDDHDEDSLPASTVLEGEPQQEKRRGRKNKEPRRVIHQEESTVQTSVNITPPAETRLNGVISNHILPPTPLPEQTEPEDLSIKGLRSRETTYHANISLATTGYSKNSLRYPKEEFMSDDDGQIPSSL